MKRIAFLLPSLCIGFTLTACPGDDGGGQVTDTESDDDDNDTDSSPTGSTVTVSTTDMPTTTEPTTTSPSTTDMPTSSESGLPECTEDDECITADDCPLPGATCTACFCTGGAGCKEYGPGAFGDCVAEGVAACMGSPGAGCVVDNPDNTTAGVCFSTCKEACDCPPPPKGYEALLTCDDLIASPELECYLACDSHDQCPDGWQCIGATFCGIGEIVELDPYGDCANLPGSCPPEVDDGAGICLGGIPGMEDESTGPGAVCSTADCADASDCPDQPATGTAAVACDPLTNGATSNCYLNCADDATCPDGMVCQTELANPVCYWETVFLDPYAECVEQEGTCPPGPNDEMSDCLSSATVSFCTNVCDDAADCPEGVGGSGLVPACIDIAMGNFCGLDCSGAEAMCPEGMDCVDVGTAEVCVNPIP